MNQAGRYLLSPLLAILFATLVAQAATERTSVQASTTLRAGTAEALRLKHICDERIHRRLSSSVALHDCESLQGIKTENNPAVVLVAAAVQPDLLPEILKYTMNAQVEALKRRAGEEMSLAVRERARGNLLAMEKHLRKAAALGSREAQARLNALKQTEK